jgi:hypothetical protein
MNFMAGINIGGKEVRKFPEKIVEVLKQTPINWIRVHMLPNRKLNEPLSEKGQRGHTYLDGINYLCRNGYNIIAPLEVGDQKNTGPVLFDDLDKFIEESYFYAACASKQISKIIEEHHRQVIFGIENEIEPKSWILQSLPGIGWRASPESWVIQALDENLRYRRLNNILKGIKDTNSSAKTMTNINAEDPRVFLDSFWSFWGELYKYYPVPKKHSIVLDDIDWKETIDWHRELLRIKNNLKVDYVGLDNYPNYIKKYPVYGLETGPKITEAKRLSGRQVLNTEFGYTTYRTRFGRLRFAFLGLDSGPQMQLQYFKNSLGSIENSPSIGTFPWLLFSDPHFSDPSQRGNPEQENYFGLMQMDRKDNLETSPSFDYYLKWLTRRLGSQRS